jgi:uncharacterized protein
MDTIIVDNKDRQRFEVLIEGEYAYIDYRWHENELVLMHTFVPEALRGRGIADKLARHVLEDVKTKNLRSKIYCPFLRTYLQRHPEYLSYTNLSKL